MSDLEILIEKFKLGKELCKYSKKLHELLLYSNIEDASYNSNTMSNTKALLLRSFKTPFFMFLIPS